jgi:hypothetical protein
VKRAARTHERLDEAVFAAYGWPSDLSAERPHVEHLGHLKYRRVAEGLAT